MSAIWNGPKKGSRKPKQLRTTSSTSCGEASPSSTQRSASRNSAFWMRLATKPGPSPTTAGRFPIDAQELDQPLDDLRFGRGGRYDLDAGRPLGRVEPVHPAEALGPPDEAGERAMFSDEVLLARIAPGRGRRVAHAQHALLDADVLRDALDDEVGAPHRVGDVVRGADLLRRGPARPVDEACVGVRPHAVGETGRRALRALRRDLREDDVEPCHDEALGDAQPHPARADDGGQAGAVDGG